MIGKLLRGEYLVILPSAFTYDGLPRALARFSRGNPSLTTAADRAYISKYLAALQLVKTRRIVLESPNTAGLPALTIESRTIAVKADLLPCALLCDSFSHLRGEVTKRLRKNISNRSKDIEAYSCV